MKTIGQVTKQELYDYVKILRDESPTGMYIGEFQAIYGDPLAVSPQGEIRAPGSDEFKDDALGEVDPWLQTR